MKAIDADKLIAEMEKCHAKGDEITVGYVKRMPNVLDKIRAEIVERQKEYHEYSWAYDDALEIINKYREEYAKAPSKDLTPDPSAEIEEDGFITWFFNRSES